VNAWIDAESIGQVAGLVREDEKSKRRSNVQTHLRGTADVQHPHRRLIILG